MAVLNKGGYLVAPKRLPGKLESLKQPAIIPKPVARPARPITVGAEPVTPVAIAPPEVRQAPTLTAPVAPVREEPGIIKSAIDKVKAVDKAATAQIADTLNVTPKTVNTVGLISLIGTGAGLLANGVKSLFDGTLKEKRAEKRAEKEKAKQLKQQQAAATLAAAAAPYLASSAKPAPGGVASPGGGFMQQAQGFISKNWMWLVPVALLLFGGKLFKKKRTYRRRPAAKPKVVYRYRTRKPATRRRR